MGQRGALGRANRVALFRNGTSMPLSVSQMITDSRPSPPAGNREERLLAGRLTGARPAVPLGSVIEAARRHRVHLLLAASMTPDERVTTDGAGVAGGLTVAGRV